MQYEHPPYWKIIVDHRRQEIIELANVILKNNQFEFVRGDDKFRHCRLQHKDTSTIIKMSPLKALYGHASRPYASIFSTSPGHYYRAHKDGKTIRWALNYLIQVNDDKCITNWYDNSIEMHYKSDQLGGVSRELENFVPENHVPVASTCFRQGQCVLFNTDVYHDFDNRLSDNWRHILTVRFSEPSTLYWNAVDDILNHASRIY